MVTFWQLLAIGGSGLSLALGMLASGRKASETDRATLGVCLKVAGALFAGFFVAVLTIAIVLKLLWGIG